MRGEQTTGLNEFKAMLHLHCVLEGNISCSGFVPARSIIPCVWMKVSLRNYIFNLLALPLLDCGKELWCCCIWMRETDGHVPTLICSNLLHPPVQRWSLHPLAEAEWTQRDFEERDQRNMQRSFAQQFVDVVQWTSSYKNSHTPMHVLLLCQASLCNKKTHKWSGLKVKHCLHTPEADAHLSVCMIHLKMSWCLFLPTGNPDLIVTTLHLSRQRSIV